MHKKDAFRFDWYPQESYAEHLLLPFELGGFLQQIKNLMGMRNKNLVPDYADIGRALGLTPKKTEKYISALVKKQVLFFTDDNLITHIRCMEEIENCHERMKKSEKTGRKNAEKRWENHRNQQDKNSSANKQDILNTNTNTDTNNTINDTNPHAHREQFSPQTIYSVEKLIPNYDVEDLIKDFWERIECGEIAMDGTPDTVFIRWCKRYSED